MNEFRKCVAGVTAFILAGISLPATANANVATRQISAAKPQLVGRVAVASVPRSMFSVRDFGRRQPIAPVTASVMLRYNRQAELDALVAAQSNRRSPLYHHFLTSVQFNNYFAPTPQQQAYVIANLQAAGLRVTHTFPNRTLLDVAGTSAAAERFFDTEIHSLSQGRYGARFANVTPASVPANLAPLVRSISLSNLVFARTGPHPVTAARLAAMQASLPRGRRAPSVTGFVLPADTSPNVAPDAANIVKEPSFESGKFGHGWNHCDGPHAYPTAQITNRKAHTGRYSGFAGSAKTSEPEQNGYSGVCQVVTIPKNGSLAAYLYQLSSEKNSKVAGQDVALLDTSGKIVATLASTIDNHAGWVLKHWNVNAYAGRKLYIYFGVHGDGDRHYYTQQYVDDVSLTTAGPAATPTPTAKPTTTPTAKPTATPAPTATPIPPTAPPTAKPTAKPTAQPTSTPTAGPVACGGTPDAGPLSNSNGTLATGVADAFDYPVQHRCDGKGTTVAVEISSPIIASDISAYLSAAGVKETGTITDEKIDGGGTVGDGANDEASLDVETIAGLAPGANIIVYDFPDLNDQSIYDGYNQTVSDNIASVANSSFGGCESSDPTFAATTESIAEQGAAMGITFVASSGDSGSDECSTGNLPPGPAAPAGDMNFVSVGGDNFTESDSGTLETLTATGDIPGTGFLSGGGVSTVVPLPSYQSGIANVVNSGRNQPDVSLPGVGVAVYYGGGSAGMFDGTSWSSPCFAALLADAIELDGARFGFVNPNIYSVFKSTGFTADFTDVTIGSNGYYQAATGYDQVTGIGAPQGYAFSKAI